MAATLALSYASAWTAASSAAAAAAAQTQLAVALGVQPSGVTATVLPQQLRRHLLVTQALALALQVRGCGWLRHGMASREEAARSDLTGAPRGCVSACASRLKTG